MKFFDVLTIFVLIALLLGAGYAFIYFIPIGQRTNTGTFSNSEDYATYANLSIKSKQFYQNLRYKDKDIAYTISSDCDSAKRENAKEAFSIISEKTIISFYQNDESPEIAVLCSDIAPTSDEKDHFIAGEGGPSRIIDTGEFSVILLGKVSLYRADSCSEPKVAEHEILHALGFDHNGNSSSILYPITNCGQQIDSSIISDIDRLYSVPPLPDLTIEGVEANKTGRYINFGINISNQGLSDSLNSTLYVYSGNEEIENYVLNDIEIGKKKMLRVGNLFSRSMDNSLRFEVKTDETELSKDNNVVDVTLE